MKRLFVCGAVIAIAALPVLSAAETPAPPEPVAYTQVTLASAYVWRGQVLDDQPVLQPYASVTSHGFTFSVWANANLSDENVATRDVNEVDLTLAYALPIEAVEVSLGVTDYLPVSSADAQYHEVFVTAKYPNAFVTPRFEAYQTFSPSVGYYLLAGLSREFALGETLALNCDFSSGFGSSDYNTFNFGVDEALVNDGSAGISLRWALSDTMSITPSVRYTWFWDSKIKDAAATFLPTESNPADPDMFVASVALDYSF